ncbi:SDR family oxidoreductase [Catenuloplanes indicus]|uniref:NAD(P)-dependent dehydrogenase (Short-subunit alcohol dehydrogenase family) n=1 Tax=Catenuloplanes indicus TaxID=137267 RepID=A0AAE4B1D0_9ACTN|nr:SDR family oxidoreductase [Catenuloplanes indicus]MDQ0370519.1 NAD(P)-dependent dehydrogenase (short-subunit alcohol dehydrogenase family) [Catenuloplanes indicus]
MTGLDLQNAVVVITGAGSGIGAAMARRFAADGATVVVNDLDPVAAHHVAHEIGGRAFAGDASDADFAERLVSFAWGSLGRLDLFCANVGVPTAGTEAAPAADWDRAWRVNVLAHVHAAKAALPRWLDRGHGRFLVTASAAGLLTMLGSAPYSVTKHAAVGFAEWLRATYAHRGIVVQALCPQGVRTPMLAGTGPLGTMLLDRDAIGADEVADRVREALSDDRFLILPHPEVAEFYARRAAEPERWLGAMNRLQQKVEHPVPKQREAPWPA